MTLAYRGSKETSQARVLGGKSVRASIYPPPPQPAVDRQLPTRG